jgi:DNA-binding winged helix-turn-helix (wHTH) protein/Tol biopolymer transport system component
MQTSILYFDQFELDLNSYELRKSGRAIRLEKLPMELLILLAESQGKLVTREQIIQRLWGDNVFVDTRQGINTAVRKLRIALKDDSENPRLLQTVPGRGYRLLAVVSSPAGAGGQIVEPAAVSPSPSTSESALANSVSKPKELWHATAMAGALAVLLAIAGSVVFLFHRNHANSASREAWIKITNFSDSATQPALSPDGRMIAFIRGPETFVTPGQIYVKILPDGEPVQLTHDDLAKMAPAFSYDGSRLAYTATDHRYAWNSWVVPVLGGEPKEMLPNAAALTWLDPQHVMFSEIPQAGATPTERKTWMGLFTATESRAEKRDIYLPPAGMVHRSWVSPDRKWVLVSKMDIKGWDPCRIVPFDGSTTGELVGPKPARCTYAGWSPDGTMMYFSADAGDGFHIWRQGFPRGKPEQMTFGATEEEGIAVAPDGRSLVTSAGIRESTVWVHGARGERQISGEGFATVPGLGMGGEKICSIFSPDGKKLYYLVRKQASGAWISGELWVSDLDSGRSELVLPGISINSNFSVSLDGKWVMFEVTDANGEPHAWTAPLDRSSPPRQITGSIAYSPVFASEGSIYFQALEGDRSFLYSAGLDGGQPKKVSSEPVPRLMGLLAVSPRAEWRIAGINPAIAYPVGGGTPVRICDFCSVGWGPEGKYFYLRFRDIGEQGGGKTVVLGLPEGKDLPDLPAGGLKSIQDTKGLNVLTEIDMQGRSIFAPGSDPSIYAYTRVTVQRNLYRIPLE